MPCVIVAPTRQSCNDLKGGAKKLEIATWTSDFDPVTGPWTEIPTLVNSVYGKDTPTVSATDQTTFFTHEVFFKINGLSNFPGWEDMVQARIVARITDYEESTIDYGLDFGLSFSGGERGTGQNLEDMPGSTLTYSGVSATAAVETAVV